MKFAFIASAIALVSANQVLEIVDDEPVEETFSKFLFGVQKSSNSCMNDVDLIKQGEGLRKCTYYDTMGIPTVCYGYNLKNYNA